MEKTTALFELAAEKKYSVVYKEKSVPNIIAGSIYVSKHLLGLSPYPESIIVTIEEVKL